MGDSRSTSVSAVAKAAAAIRSAKSLHETTKIYKGMNKSLDSLQVELGDFRAVLERLQVVDLEISQLTALEPVISRCDQQCHDFEKFVEELCGNPKMDFRTWAKLRFFRDRINEFRTTLATYQATFMVGIGSINLYVTRPPLFLRL